MGGRPGDASRLPAPDRPSHQAPSSSSYPFPPHRPPQNSNASRHRSSPSPEHGPHPLTSSSRSGRPEQPSHVPHYYPPAADLRSPRDAPTRYERGRGERRSASPIHPAGSATRLRSSSPPFRSRNARTADTNAQSGFRGSADSEAYEGSAKSDDPQTYHPDGNRSQQGDRGESDRYQPPEEVYATMSSVSEPTSRPRSPHKRRTRMLMSRNQWQALSRLWDRTIFPATAEREALAREIGLTPRQVQVWFQNQRQKRRRERETDAANAALVASSPYFAAARTAELPHTWNGGPPPRHWADGEDHCPYTPSSSRQSSMPGPPIPNGYDQRAHGGAHVGYGFARHDEHPRQGWPELNAQRWRSNPMLARERELEREYDRGVLDKDRGFEREREFVREPATERDRDRDDSLSSRPRGYYYPGPPPSGQREDRWQHSPRPTPSPHHSYMPSSQPQPQYSGRDSRSPHSPWSPNDAGAMATTDRTASPGLPPPAGAAPHPLYYAPEPRISQVDEHHRSHRPVSSPGPSRQRGPQYLPPSLSALAIDRPLDRDAREGRMPPSYLGDGNRETGAHQGLQAHHVSPYTHSAPPRPPLPPSPGSGTSRPPPHSREPRPRDPKHTGDPSSPPRLPSLSSLLH